MSKNRKFLRNGVLFLAVMAMVLGQCFGVFGSVAAQAANAAEDYQVLSVKWNEKPEETYVLNAKDTMSVDIELKARRNLDEGTVKGLLNILLHEEFDPNFHEVFSLDVKVPQMWKNETKIINVKIDVPTGVVRKWDLKVEAALDNNNKAETEVVTYRVTEDPLAFELPVYNEDGIPTPTKIYVSYADTVTGQKLSVPEAVDFGDNLKKTHGIFLTKLGSNGQHQRVEIDGTLTLTNPAYPGRAVKVPVTDGIADMSKVVVNPAVSNHDIDTSIFEAGVNTLQVTFKAAQNEFTGLNLPRTYVTVIVNPVVPDVDLFGMDAQLLWNERDNTVIGGKNEEWIVLDVENANWRNSDDRQKVFLDAQVTDDWYGANKPEEGYFEFYDNGALVGTVKLGEFDDQIPYTTNHRAEDWENIELDENEAAIAFITTAGKHVYSAKFVPTEKAAKILTTGVSENINVDYSVFQETTFTLTADPEVILRGEEVTFTLKFNKAPGAGEATFYLVNDDNDDDTDTLHFNLNDKDLVYTDTVEVWHPGTFNIECPPNYSYGHVWFLMDGEVYLFNPDYVGRNEIKDRNDYSYTQKPVMLDEFCVDTDMDFINVYEEYSYIDVTVDNAAPHFGDDVTITAKVTDAKGNVINVGWVSIYAVDKYPVDEDTNWYKVGERNLAEVKANENPADWGTFTAVDKNMMHWDMVGYVAVYDPDRAAPYYAPSEDFAACALVKDAGELEVIEVVGNPVNNQDETADLVEFKVALIDSATGKIATDVSTGEIHASFIDGYAIPEWQNIFKGYITNGVASIYIENEILRHLEMGTYPIQFSLVDTWYEADDIKSYFTIQDYDLIPVELRAELVDDNPLFAKVRVEVWEADKQSGRLYDASGYVDVTVGGEKVTLDNYMYPEFDGQINSGYAIVYVPKIGLTSGANKTIEVTYHGDMKYAADKVTCTKTLAVDYSDIIDAVMGAINGDKFFDVTATRNELDISLTELKLGLLVDYLVKIYGPEYADVIGKLMASMIRPDIEYVTGFMSVIDLAAEFLGNKAWTKAAFEIYDGDRLIGTIDVDTDDLSNDYTFTVPAEINFSGAKEITVVLKTNFDIGQTETVVADIPEFTTTGWYQDPATGDWYLFDAEGVMLKGWQKVGAYWYYLADDTGIMLTGWQKLNYNGIENTYYFDATNGNMKTGWQLIGGEWYLFNASGEQLFGWQKMGGAWYYLDATQNGMMLKGFQDLEWNGETATYYFNKLNGNMQTGWILVDGNWYFAYTNGTLAKNTTIAGWTAGEDGIFTKDVVA